MDTTESLQQELSRRLPNVKLSEAHLQILDNIHNVETLSVQKLRTLLKKAGKGLQWKNGQEQALLAMMQERGKRIQLAGLDVPQSVRDGPALSAEQLDHIEEEWRDVFERLEHGDAPDLRPMMDRYEELNPGVQYQGARINLRTASYGTANECLLTVHNHCFLPSDRLFFLQQFGPGATVFSKGKVDRSSWRSHQYLGENVWSASMQRQEGPIAVALNEFAFTDGVEAVRQARNMYRTIKTIPAINAFGELLEYWIRKFDMEEEQYCQLFGKRRLELEEKNHAFDHIYEEKWAAATGNTSLSDPEKTMQALIKPDSLFWDEWRDYGPDNRLLVRRAAAEYTAQIAGLIDEMQELIDAGNPDFAYLAFLDYMSDSAGYTQGASVGRFRSQTYYALAIKGAILFSGFVGNDLQQVLTQQKIGNEHLAHRVHTLLRQNFARNTVTTEERKAFLERKM